MSKTNSENDAENTITKNEDLDTKTNTTANLSSVEFSNQQIDLAEISTSTLNMLELSPKFRLMNMWLNAFWGGLLLIIITVLSNNWLFDIPPDAQTFVLSAYVIVASLTLWGLVFHWFADPLKKYAVREHDLNYQSGLIFRRLVSQPILRIQHIEIKRGPIERKAGLATLQVFSAGGVSHTFNIPGLAFERAVELRQFILDHKDLASDV